MKRKPSMKDYIAASLLISYALYILGIAILTIISHQ